MDKVEENEEGKEKEKDYPLYDAGIRKMMNTQYNRVLSVETLEIY